MHLLWVILPGSCILKLHIRCHTGDWEDILQKWSTDASNVTRLSGRNGVWHNILEHKWRETLSMQQLFYKDFSQNDLLVNHLRIQTD